MATILKPLNLTPFTRTPGLLSCRLDEPFDFSTTDPNLDVPSPNDLLHASRSNSVTGSLFSGALASIHRNGENLSPLARKGDSTKAAVRSASTSSPGRWGSPKSTSSLQAPSFSFQPLVVLPTNKELVANSAADIEEKEEATVISRQRNTPETPRLPCTPRMRYSSLSDSALTSQGNAEIKLQSRNAMNTSEIGILNRLKELRHRSKDAGSIVSNFSALEKVGSYGQKLSDGSSAFVRSMKTASLTNTSISFHHRSSMLNKSSDSYLLHGSQPRQSLESSRPLTSNSMDDAATHRSVKRQHVIDELIATEESYVSDLKALTYLYSTLLASAYVAPNRVRVAVEQTLNAILHLHELLLENLHRVRFHAAARRWAATVIPTRLEWSRRDHFRSSDSMGQARNVGHQRHTRPEDSAAVPSAQAQNFGFAEPTDVHEIALVFKEVITSFHVYEEYCAKFEIIGSELQKEMPQLWSTYESGIECLARIILSVDQRQANERKGLTVGDLLIKPIQRLTKYPLMLSQLLQHMPISDGPDAHLELELVLRNLCEIVQAVNLARDNHQVRQQVQRRWRLLDCLDLTQLHISDESFRSLGSIQLCGILHVAYQSSTCINGGYALCVLFDKHLLIAFPVLHSKGFVAKALIQLCDIEIQAPTDGKALDIKSVTLALALRKSISRDSSVQRAATVGNRPSISHVIIRNTYNLQGLHERRVSLTQSHINRSQSHMAVKRIPVLEPKRSERIRLENCISDIWTKERLPFPGMVGSRSGQIIRASAGSLARKLSLASIHTTFARDRTTSLSMGSRKSCDPFHEVDPTFEMRRKEATRSPKARIKPAEIPEVDDMRSVIERMIGNTLPGGRKASEPIMHRSWSKKTRKISAQTVGASNPAEMFYEPQALSAIAYETARRDCESNAMVGVGNGRPRRRQQRWSRPISKLKEFGSEAKSIFYPTSSTAE